MLVVDLVDTGKLRIMCKSWQKHHLTIREFFLVQQVQSSLSYLPLAYLHDFLVISVGYLYVVL